jgi:hypothetical protein
LKARAKLNNLKEPFKVMPLFIKLIN